MICVKVTSVNQYSCEGCGTASDAEIDTDIETCGFDKIMEKVFGQQDTHAEEDNDDNSSA